MDFRLTEEQEAFRKAVARFVDTEVAPVADGLDETGEFPRALFRKLGDPLGEAHTLSGLGEVERENGDRDLAQRDFEAAAQLYDAAGQADRAAWAQQQADELVE